MRDLYVLETFTDDGLTIRTGPVTIAEAMNSVDAHVAPNNWRHRYLGLTPTDQAVKHWTAARHPRPAEGADFFTALRRAIICDPKRDGLDDHVVVALLAHVDPHRPWQLYRADEEHLLGECDCPRNEAGVCAEMEPAERVCVACTAVIDSRSEFGPHIEIRAPWPCSVIAAAAAQYDVLMDTATNPSAVDGA
ncbi:MAG TPA: hypothetical protein VF657_09925 [Actinoplanes sp.]